MASVNKVILIGNLGKDPEVRHLESGVAVARFSLATSEVFKDKNGERQERTEWHNIVAWRGLAEVAEKILRKGLSVYVEGKIQSRSYQDKDNQTRYVTEIVADSLEILTPKGESSQTSGSNGSSSGGFQGGASSQSAGQSQSSGQSSAASSGKGNASAFQNDEPDDLPF